MMNFYDYIHMSQTTYTILWHVSIMFRWIYYNRLVSTNMVVRNMTNGMHHLVALSFGVRRRTISLPRYTVVHCYDLNHIFKYFQ